MQPSKERAVFVSKLDERIHLLLERKIHADADGMCFTREIDALVCSLHQSWTTAGNDVATHFRQRLRDPFRFFISNRSRLRSRGSEYGHAIAIPPRRLQARQVVNHVPQTQH